MAPSTLAALKTRPTVDTQRPVFLEVTEKEMRTQKEVQVMAETGKNNTAKGKRPETKLEREVLQIPDTQQ